MCEKLARNGNLTFIEKVIAGSKIALKTKPSQSPAAASSSNFAAEEKSTIQAAATGR